MLKSLLQFLYPAECLHCDGAVQSSRHPLCRACLSQIEWSQRGCIYCGVPIDAGKCCSVCLTHPLRLQPHTSLSLPLGPLFYLHQASRRAECPETLAALIIIGLEQQHPSPLVPDCVVPLLRPRYEQFFLKKQSSALLARSVAKLLRLPTLFPCKKVQGKGVWLITDWLEDRETLLAKKRELKQFFPQKIYSIALIDAR